MVNLYEIQIIQIVLIFVTSCRKKLISASQYFSFQKTINIKNVVVKYMLIFFKWLLVKVIVNVFGFANPKVLFY